MRQGFVVELANPVSGLFLRDLEERILLLSNTIVDLKARVDGDDVVAVDVGLDGASVDRERLRSLIRNTAEDVRAAAKKIEYVDKVVDEGSVRSTVDPHGMLLESGDLVQTGKGTFVIQGALRTALEALDALFGGWFRAEGCEEQLYPVLLDAQPLFDLNYFETMGHHIFYPVSVTGDYDAIKGFASRNSRGSNSARSLSFIAGDTEPPRQVISPTVCFHCFSALFGRTITPTRRAFTAKNPCAREERAAATGLERLQSFTMREAIFFGTAEEMEARFADLEVKLTGLFREWELKFRIRSANDPFFGQTGARSRVFQTAFNLKYELQVYLPYLDRYLACGSLNRHLTSMVKAFQISTEVGELQSMCLGIGYERLILALLAQTGMTAAQLTQFLASASRPGPAGSRH